MSNFLINLARRGAGLAPQMPVEPRFSSVFLPVLEGLAPETVSDADLPTGVMRTPIREGLEVPGQSIKVSSPTAQPASSPPQNAVGAPATPIMDSPGGPASPPPGLRPRPPLPPTRDVGSTQEQVWTPAPVPQEKGSVLAAAAPEAPHSARAVDAQPQTANQEVVRPRPVFQPSLREKIVDHERVKVFHPESQEPAPEGPRPSGEVRIEPDKSAESERRQPLIRPAPAQPPEPLLAEKASMPPAAVRPIQVRIGTIEVRAATPSASAPIARPEPSSQGFEAYRLLRSYTSLD